MSDVNVQLVREFFELNAFRVMTNWQHDLLRARGADHGLQMFVENTMHDPLQRAEFVLGPGEARALTRAVVAVRAWHADRVYASHIESNPVLLDVVSEESLARARQVFDDDSFDTVLVISELPASPEARERSITLFREAGLSHIVEFPTILHDMLDQISAGVSYGPSHTLQTLRLLKRYHFLQRQQLELPFPTEPPVRNTPPEVETADALEEDGEDAQED